jgi:HD-GYP domain-containing protein (c-di-GMP phosphodiesterase class II)
MRDEIIREFHEIISPEFRKWLQDNAFYAAPAAIKWHGNHQGGLLEHSAEVAYQLKEITDKLGLDWQREESPIIVGMLHDICKIDTWKIDKDGNYAWEKDTLYTGHGDKSLMILSSHIQLTEEEAACIRYHMGAFTDKEEWNYYTRAVRDYPNVLFTHTADMIASQIKNI